MQENLIGYLLNALDERTSRQVQSELEQNRDAREQLALLEQALAPLASDREAPAPPSQLTERTLARIAEHICGTTQPAIDLDLPKAPVVSRAALPYRSWWRRSDVAAAACLLAMITGLTLTTLARLRSPNSQTVIADCKDNLRQLFTSLQRYRDAHGQFPDVAKESPRNVAGMVVPMLADAGTLPQNVSFGCPGNGAPLANQYTLAELRGMSDAQFAKHAPHLSRCYAYSLGYRDAQGVYHGPGTEPIGNFSQLPIMADRPPAEGIMQNSLNHGGAGQNVLFSDGHVNFLPQRLIGNNDDIFLNDKLKVAAGVGPADVVLGYSAAKP